MVVRVVAALVALSVVVPALAFGGVLAVDILVPLVGLVCLYEYRAMACPETSLVGSAWLVLATAIVYVCGTYLPDYFAVSVSMVTIGSLIYATLYPGETLKDGPAIAGKFLMGICWLGVLLPAFPLLRRMENGLAWLALVLVIAWMSDTGAYFVGRSFGKRKLYERVSPKKTWEGVYGGMAAAVLGVFVMNTYFLEQFSGIECVVLGVILSALGVVGDLAESLVKRAYGVKDSGKIMPGHGGLLDRIDSLLFVGPALYGYLSIVAG